MSRFVYHRKIYRVILDKVGRVLEAEVAQKFSCNLPISAIRCRIILIGIKELIYFSGEGQCK